MRQALGKQFTKGDMTLPFREACRVDNVVYLSGQLAFGADGGLVGEDIQTQTRQVFQNIENVLASCDLQLDSVFKVTAWLQNAADFPAFNAAFGECLDGNLPVRSTVRCDLLLPGALVELEVQAHTGD